uniref:EOG090X0O5J n=1 Tax=Simocephalus serrulatus TaxID=117539 RepID=A0A4Y7NPJ4_9CRUS|nr:EOG090X0O5J [Simocephalus serrulatus]SVE94673.1 EOG090X0O5J [Simocephalus serrulatus]
MLSLKKVSGLVSNLRLTVCRQIYLSRKNESDDFKNSNNQAEMDEIPTPNVGMEKTINSVTLLGRVGSNPVKRGSIEHPVVTFSLATNSNYSYASGEVNQKTEWHRICVFKPYLRDSTFKYTMKGQRVLVQGRIIYGEVKESDGQLRHTCSIVADDVIFFKNG